MQLNSSNTLKIDTLSDLKSIAIQELTNAGLTITDTSDTRKVFLRYLGYRHRLIVQRPRTIYKPSNFICPLGYEEGLALVEQKIQNGEDLTIHQSRKILNVNYKDPLLNDWGIQHLHLGTEMADNKPLIKGTSEILFVYFKEDKAYFICVAGHCKWSDQDMIRTLHDNFPEAIESWRMDDMSLVHVPTNDDIDMMRKAGIVSGLEVYPGVTYLSPGGGYATDGTNIWVTMAANRYHHFTSRLDKYYVEKEEQIRVDLEAKGYVLPDIVTLKLMKERNEFVVIEESLKIELYRINEKDI